MSSNHSPVSPVLTCHSRMLLHNVVMLCSLSYGSLLDCSLLHLILSPPGFASINSPHYASPWGAKCLLKVCSTNFSCGFSLIDRKVKRMCLKLLACRNNRWSGRQRKYTETDFSGAKTNILKKHAKIKRDGIKTGDLSESEALILLVVHTRHLTRLAQDYDPALNPTEGFFFFKIETLLSTTQCRDYKCFQNWFLEILLIGYQPSHTKCQKELSLHLSLMRDLFLY